MRTDFKVKHGVGLGMAAFRVALLYMQGSSAE